MTYGRTFARGGGLVWYEGAPRVEGFTNPLWTVMMAGLHRVGLAGSGAAFVVMILGLICVLVTAAISGLASRKVFPQLLWAPWVTTCVAALLYPILFWSLSGMEVGFLLTVTLSLMYLSLMLADVAADAGQRRRLLAGCSLLVAVGLATRLDFMVVAFVVCAWLYWASRSDARRVNSATIGATAIITAVILTLARHAYYGDWLPNTYYLKVEGAALASRLERGLITDLKLVPSLVILGIAIAVIWPRVGTASRRGLALLVATGLACVAYSTYVGGDAWEEMPNRYVAPLFVMVAVVVVAALEFLARDVESIKVRYAVIAGALLVLTGVGLAFSGQDWFGDGALGGYFSKRWLIAGLGVLALLVIAIVMAVMRAPRSRTAKLALPVLGMTLLMFTSSGIGYFKWLQDGGYGVQFTQQQVERGIVLGQVTKPGARIAVMVAGAPIYYSDRAGLDLLGKSDRKIAREAPRRTFHPGHNKYDYEYGVLQARPDVITELGFPASESTQGQIDKLYELKCITARGLPTQIWVKRDSAFVTRDSPLLESCG